jgi:hypothetical protein
MPSSSDEDENETESFTYLKSSPDPLLNYWEGVAFHKLDKALNNALIPLYLDIMVTQHFVGSMTH